MTEARTTHARRRLPTQSRARVTSEAIQQAFLQLLTEKSYAKVSIREVITLAGVGIGSFYEYFSTKDALAAVCIRRQVRATAVAMGQRIAATQALPLPERVDALMQAQCAVPLAQPDLWGTLFLLERQVSGIEAFRSLYEEFVALWARVLAPDVPAASVQDAALVSHAIVYGLVSQWLMVRGAPRDTSGVWRLVRDAVHGNLAQVAPQAYQGFGR